MNVTFQVPADEFFPVLVGGPTGGHSGGLSRRSKFPQTENNEAPCTAGLRAPGGLKTGVGRQAAFQTLRTDQINRRSMRNTRILGIVRPQTETGIQALLNRYGLDREPSPRAIVASGQRKSSARQRATHLRAQVDDAKATELAALMADAPIRFAQPQREKPAQAAIYEWRPAPGTPRPTQPDTIINNSARERDRHAAMEAADGRAAHLRACKAELETLQRQRGSHAALGWVRMIATDDNPAILEK